MRRLVHSYGVILIMVLLCYHGQAQTPVEGTLTYHKLPDNQVRISVGLSDSEESEPVEGVNIEFFTVLDSARTSLGTSTTDPEGKAVLEGVPFSNLLLTPNHQFNLAFELAGDYLLESPEQFTFSDMEMKLTFEEIDSVKQIVAMMYSWDDDGNQIPLEEIDAYLYVPRLFSLLPIGDVYTDEEGLGTAKFPTDLPGDKNGELEVILKVEDHDQFGNVAVSATTDWGVPGQPEVSRLPRALWSPDAPLWMWITFIILMTGVWGHYLWIIVNLYRIKSHTSDTGSIIYED